MPSTTQDLVEPLTHSRITRHFIVGSCEFGRNPTNPPVVDIYGICQALEFTVGTDKAYYKLHIPEDLVPGTSVKIHIHWTRSGVAGDESGKTVKWQLKYLMVNGRSENVNSGESTLSVQDTYDSSSAADQVAYQTPDLTIPGSMISLEHCLVLELMAIAPTGTALTEPACVGIGLSYTSYQAHS